MSVTFVDSAGREELTERLILSSAFDVSIDTDGLVNLDFNQVFAKTNEPNTWTALQTFSAGAVVGTDPGGAGILRVGGEAAFGDGADVKIAVGDRAEIVLLGTDGSPGANDVALYERTGLFYAQSLGNFVIAIDSNNNTTTALFQIVKDDVAHLGTEVFNVMETGDITITGSWINNQNSDISLRRGGTDELIVATGEVRVRQIDTITAADLPIQRGGVTKLTVLSGGIDVTGEARCDSLRIDQAPSTTTGTASWITHYIQIKDDTGGDVYLGARTAVPPT